MNLTQQMRKLASPSGRASVNDSGGRWLVYRLVTRWLIPSHQRTPQRVHTPGAGVGIHPPMATLPLRSPTPPGPVESSIRRVRSAFGGGRREERRERVCVLCLQHSLASGRPHAPLPNPIQSPTIPSHPNPSRQARLACVVPGPGPGLGQPTPGRSSRHRWVLFSPSELVACSSAARCWLSWMSAGYPYEQSVTDYERSRRSMPCHALPHPGR